MLARIHSQCLTGDTLGSLTCDCGEQLQMSFEMIQRAGSGVLLYLNQEGRGIGLSNKIKAYAHQRRGLDTVEANRILGFAPDLRDYRIAAGMLHDLGIREITLLTNNPGKIKALEANGIRVVKRLPLETVPTADNYRYLATKKETRAQIKLGVTCMENISPKRHRVSKTRVTACEKGLGRTFPNPMVGAVVVKRGQVVGRGYHRKAGLPHAEIEALRVAGRSAEGATLYLNLEPCNHWGRTPPCVPKIAEAKVARVVCCSFDPNPKVCGMGIRALRRTGIRVSVGALAVEAEMLNEGFFKFHRAGRPFIAIKFASSMDGKIATRSGSSRWITNEQARKYARSLRRNYQAVLVGINTVLHDDPHLGVRISGVPDPLELFWTAL